MDKEDELLEMADVTSHSDSSEKSKRGVSLKLTGVRLTTHYLATVISVRMFAS